MKYINEAGWDRIIRILLGIVLVALGFGGVVAGTLGLVAKILGIILLVTGVSGFCLLYAIFKVRTNKEQLD